MDKTLPYPLNTNATTDEDRYEDNADKSDLAAVITLLSALENNPIIKSILPSQDGNYTLKVSISGSKVTAAWSPAADGNLPAVPAVEGTYNLSVTDEDGDTVIAWAAIPAAEE